MRRFVPIVGSLGGLLVLAACSGDGREPVILTPQGQQGQQAQPAAPAPTTQSPPAMPVAPVADGSAGAPAMDSTSPPPVQQEPEAPAQPPGPGATTPIDPTVPDPTTGEPPAPALDECGLESGWIGDDYCILPPPPERGFQIHVGPADYDDPEERYVIEPGEESNLYFDAVSGNDEPVYFYYRQYRLRPGTHHLVLTEARSGLGLDGGSGRRLGGSQNLIKDNPDGGVIPPENVGVGAPLEARVPLSVNLHYLNTTDQPIIQEAWINVWYKDPAEVTEEAHELFLLGSVSFAVQPFEERTLGPYGCNVQGSGRVLSLYGHRHANAPRFTAWRVRDGQRELIYESLDWAEPMVLEFNSVTENSPADRAAGLQGGHSGILDLQAGDRLEWECHVVNESDGVLRFTNQTYEGEMCILIGDTVGTRVACAPN